jgi:hypothetical protein
MIFIFYISNIRKLYHNNMNLQGTISTYELTKILQQNLPEGRVVLYEREDDNYIFIDRDELKNYSPDGKSEVNEYKELVELISGGRVYLFDKTIFDSYWKS